MKKTINLLVLLFAVLLLICVAPMAFAEDPYSGSCGDNVTYVYDDTTNTLTISGTGSMADYNEYSPDPIVHAPWNSVKGDITRIVIEEGVTRLGNFVFFGCEYVTSVSFPSSLKTIGEGAFGECTGLTNFSLPYQIETLEKGAFDKCENLIISIPSNSNLKTIGEGALDYIANTSITLPNSVETIGALSFIAAVNLETVRLGTNISYIGGSAFYIMQNDEVYGPTTIYTCMTQDQWDAIDMDTTIPDDIDDDAGITAHLPFRADATIVTEAHKASSTPSWTWADDCRSASVSYSCDYCRQSIRETVNAVETTENGKTTAKVEITLDGTTYSKEETVGASGTCGLNGDNLTWVYDHGVLTISGTGEMADYTRKNLTSYALTAPWDGFEIRTLVVEEGVTSIGTYAFCNYRKLSSVSLPSTLTKIGSLSFFQCTSLSSITFPENLDSIDAGAFWITALTEVVIPNSVTKIEAFAFVGCPLLKTIRLGTGLQTIGECAFYSGSDDSTYANTMLRGIVTCMTDDEWAAVEKGENYYDPNQVTIQTNAHEASEAVIENVIPATCMENGSYNVVEYCKFCSKELSRESEAIEAIGHNYDNPVANWAENYSSATITVTCKKCGDKVTETATVASRPGTKDNTIYTATATIEGKTFIVTYDTANDKEPPVPAYRCSMCNTYDKYKDNKVFGWLITIVHFFIHLASRLGASV